MPPDRRYPEPRPGGLRNDGIDHTAMSDDRQIEQAEFAELARTGDPKLRGSSWSRSTSGWLGTAPAASPVVASRWTT